MRTGISRKRILVCISLVCLMVFGTALSAFAADVTPSDVNYTVTYTDSMDVFLCNRKALSGGAGTEMYLTYTVESVDKMEADQHGIVGTDAPTMAFPYMDGGVLQYNFDKKLVEEGYTYFYKFVTVGDNVECTVSRIKGNESEYHEFTAEYGDKTDKYTHFGIWLGRAPLTAKLVNVRCYDKNGNDLGLQLTKGKNAVVTATDPLWTNKEIYNTYNVKVENQKNTAISNQFAPKTDVIYMEYSVKSAESSVYQSGVFQAQTMRESYPFENGRGMYMNSFHEDNGNGDLLVPGAHYLIKFTRYADSYAVSVQRTYDGKREFLTFDDQYGVYVKDASFYGLFFGEGYDFVSNFELTNVKFYDSENNNLGVQLNVPAVVKGFGEIENYEPCAASYYCEKENSLITLYADRTVKKHADGEEETGQYQIHSGVITMTFGDEAESYDYAYCLFSRDDTLYRRLYNYTLNFDTGSEEKVEAQAFNYENGYMARLPKEPILEGNTFEGWFLSNGAAYDFEKVVTKSDTVYAKWSDGGTKEYVTVSGQSSNIAPVVSIVVSTVLLVATTIICVGILNKNNKKG